MGEGNQHEHRMEMLTGEGRPQHENHMEPDDGGADRRSGE